jgi:tetratricopeptide (TPR) repeat protein
MTNRHLHSALSLLAALGAAFPAAAGAETPSPDASQTPATGAASTARYFAVTLVTSFTPITIKAAVQKQLPNLIVYETTGDIFGKHMYFLRVGFFASFADASATKDSLLASYPGAWATEVHKSEYDVAVSGGRIAPPPRQETNVAEVPRRRPTPPPAPPPQVQVTYALNLETSSKVEVAPARPLPADFSNKRLYVARREMAGQTRYLLNVGFYATAAEAETARKHLLATFPNATVVSVSHEEQQTSAGTSIQSPAAAARLAPEPLPASTVPRTQSALDRRAAPLMAKGRDALTRGDYATAIVTFDQLLRLPPNSYSQDAQEYIGLAHERNGEIVAAQREYELYLKLYPETEGAARVRQRIAALSMPATTTVLTPVKRKVATSESSVFGNWSQYYYHGAEQRDTTLTTSPTAPNVTPADNFTGTQTKTLRSSLNLTERTRTENYDNRAVVRDTYIKDYLDNARTENRIYSLYYELKQRRNQYSARIGRQPASAGGVLGYFDGALAGVALTPQLHFNVVGGRPADITKLYKLDSTRSFVGESIDAGTFFGHWSTSLYHIKETVDGVTDREAVGSELRYFDETKSFYGLADYDTFFGVTNTTMLQGNWTIRPSNTHATTLNVLIDHRRSPALELTNALIGETTTSINKLRETYTLDELKDHALGNTPVMGMYSLGVTQGLGPKWQVNADVRKTHTSATSGSPAQGPLAASGGVYNYGLQLIGTGLFSARDISVLGYNYTTAPTFHVNTVNASIRAVFAKNWTLDTSLIWYQQSVSNPEQKIDGLTPDVKLSYVIKNRVTLEAEYYQLHSTATQPGQVTKTKDDFWTLGYRWDF